MANSGRSHNLNVNLGEAMKMAQMLERSQTIKRGTGKEQAD
jgi:hypothetical protein